MSREISGEGSAPTGPYYLLADCGSTVTKVALVGRQAGAGRVLACTEAVTTVEAPINDVTVGLRDALRELERSAGRRLLAGTDAAKLVPSDGDDGSDGLLVCSSAGGGLQMLVMGAVRQITAESAARAALGAGAIISEVVACNDIRSAAEQSALLRCLQPDMVLLSGGVDGGSREHVLQLAELLAAAEPRPRFGRRGELPVIFAGNRDAREAVSGVLAERVALEIVPNLRPTLGTENLTPARQRILALFMTHVMSRAPGYDRLTTMCTDAIRPTPTACGDALLLLADGFPGGILAVDVGGATTDIFSVQGKRLHRTVSANLGVSYSLGQVLREVELTAISRWLPEPLPAAELQNRILNKMIHPTTLPHLAKDLQWEQAVAREVMALALSQHWQLAPGPPVAPRDREVGDAFRSDAPAFACDPAGIEVIIGRGGVLSHAPEPQEAFLMLVDALAPVGVTRLALDRQGILPQIGVLIDRDPDLARELLATDALVWLGTCVAPLNKPSRRQGHVARYRLTGDSREWSGELARGELCWHSLPAGCHAELVLEPGRGVDWGAGPGNPVRCLVHGGVCGIMLDARQRWHQPADPAEGWGRS